MGALPVIAVGAVALLAAAGLGVGAFLVGEVEKKDLIGALAKSEGQRPETYKPVMYSVMNDDAKAAAGWAKLGARRHGDGDITIPGGDRKSVNNDLSPSEAAAAEEAARKKKEAEALKLKEAAAAEEIARKKKEAETLKLKEAAAAEEAARKKKEAEAARKKKEAEALQLKRAAAAEEVARKKKEAEALQLKRAAAAEEVARKKKEAIENRTKKEIQDKRQQQNENAKGKRLAQPRETEQQRDAREASEKAEKEKSDKAIQKFKDARSRRLNAEGGGQSADHVEPRTDVQNYAVAPYDYYKGKDDEDQQLQAAIHASLKYA